jgi:hypothetical protein
LEHLPNAKGRSTTRIVALSSYRRDSSSEQLILEKHKAIATHGTKLEIWFDGVWCHSLIANLAKPDGSVRDIAIFPLVKILLRIAQLKDVDASWMRGASGSPSGVAEFIES